MISSQDLKYLKLAESVALSSDYKRIHIGCCIIKKKEIISTGFNKNKTHPLQFKYNKFLSYDVKKPKLHAEMDALIKAGKDAKGGTLYIFRRGNDNLYRISKPCKACMKFIRDSGIKRVVYTTENGIKEIILEKENALNNYKG